jgi:hypothetical protein
MMRNPIAFWTWLSIALLTVAFWLTVALWGIGALR